MRQLIYSTIAFVLLLSLIFSLSSCDVADTAYTAELGGFVYDAATREPVSGVHVSSIPYFEKYTTGLDGFFYIQNISIPKDEQNIIVVFDKEDYNVLKVSTKLKANEWTLLDSVLIVPSK